MKVALDQVRVRGAGVVITQEDVLLVVTFSAVLNSRVAKKLNIYDQCYTENSGTPALRLFDDLKFRFGFEAAELEMYQTLDSKIGPAKISVMTAKGFEVAQSKDGAELKFRVRVPLDEAQMTYYLKNQKKEPAPKFVIVGTQRELPFDGARDDGEEPPAETAPEQTTLEA